MDWLNYHHLYYFWVVAHEGGIAAAAKELNLAPPTIHSQLKTFEQAIGQKLLSRSGRHLELTDTGKFVLGYADEIFSLGRELTSTLKQMDVAPLKPTKFNVGIVDSVPKIMVKWLLEPAMHLDPPMYLKVREGKLDQLVPELATHRLDMILADHSYRSPSSIKIYHHRLGDCGIAFLASPELAKKLRPGFPNSLNGAPAILPTENTAMRGSIEAWFESQKIRPRIVAEFEDSALIKVFGTDHRGFFVMPSIGSKEVAATYGVEIIGTTDACREEFYALSAERKLTHPAVIAIKNTARDDLFEPAPAS